MNKLDDWLTHAPAGGASLDDLETSVWARVRELRSERAQTRFRVVAVAFALSVGIANGGVGATLLQPPRSEMAVFTSASLSPLARLEAG
ncbi:hypothetical protein [Brevundimonas vesicularis]|uniref:hypothetical protein n=1 Tax=Brevundimonas vesicularis TaxID=41276 RepID=UPI00082A5442|nr:hypothetical protein [Brevundimonas vesicularis]